MPKQIDEYKVYQAVIDMLIEYGYDGATTKEIAAVAGVNEATLFRKYGSKAELFERAINEQFANAPLRAVAYTGSLEDDLLAIVKAYLETNTLYGEVLSALLAAIARHPELKDAFQSVWQNIQIMVDLVQRYQQAGVLRDESPFLCLNALIGPLMSDRLFRRAELELPLSELDPEQYVAAFLAGRKV